MRQTLRAIYRSCERDAAVAVVLMHGWQFPQHEREAASIARSLGFEEVSVSHELSPLVRYVARG